MHIANNMMEYGAIKSLPVNHILFSLDTDELHAFKNGSVYITSEPESGMFRLHKVSNNVHIMNKRAILRYKDEIVAYAYN